VTGLVLQAFESAPLMNEQTLYRYTAAVLGAAAVLCLVWTTRLPNRHRRYGLFATYMTGALGLTYVAMSVGVLRFSSAGAAIPATRYVGYVVIIAPMLLVTGYIGGMSRRLLAALLVPFAMILAGNFAGWLLSGTAGSLAPLVSLLSLPLAAYLLLGPGRRAAEETTEDRKLLYGKLANLLLLVWVGYLVLGTASRQNADLLDVFTGVFLGAYVDSLLVVGFAVILLRHTGALDDVVAASGGETVGGGGAETDASVAAD
jgi:sensory rhodopsin